MYLYAYSWEILYRLNIRDNDCSRKTYYQLGNILITDSLRAAVFLEVPHPEIPVHSNGFSSRLK